jgi:putative NADPH-quinone reductase
MKISLILAHPNPASFNHAIAKVAAEELARRKHEVRFHDLYAEGFPAVLTWQELTENVSASKATEAHCREIAEADGIVIVHPNWWGMPPAILKGWIDRVLRMEVAYRFHEEDSGGGEPEGLLRAKAALVINTANTPADRETKVFGDPLETLWRNCVFGLCGVKNVHREIYRVVITSTASERRQWLERTRALVAKFFP